MRWLVGRGLQWSSPRLTSAPCQAGACSEDPSASLRNWGRDSWGLCACCVLAGNSSECPAPGNAEDDTVCLDLGKCKDGKCVPFCEREQQLESCACNGEHISLPRPYSEATMACVCLAVLYVGARQCQQFTAVRTVVRT